MIVTIWVGAQWIFDGWVKAEILETELQRAAKSCPRSPREMAAQPRLSDKELGCLPLSSLPSTEIQSPDNCLQGFLSPPIHLHWYVPLLGLSLISKLEIHWSYRKHFIWPSTCKFFPLGFLGVGLHPSPHGHKHLCVCSLAPGIPEITAGPYIRMLGHSEPFLHWHRPFPTQASPVHQSTKQPLQVRTGRGT